MLKISELASCWSYLGQFPYHNPTAGKTAAEQHGGSTGADDSASSRWALPVSTHPPIPSDNEEPLGRRIERVAAMLDKVFPGATERFRACTIMSQCIETIAPRFVLVDSPDDEPSSRDDQLFGCNRTTWSRIRETMLVTLIYYAWAPCARKSRNGEPSNVDVQSDQDSGMLPCFFSENPFLHAILLAQVEYGRIVNEVVKTAQTLASERPDVPAAERQTQAAAVVARQHASTLAAQGTTNVPPSIGIRWEDLRREVSTLERLLIEANLLEIASFAMPVALAPVDKELTNAQAQAKAFSSALISSLPSGAAFPHPLSLVPPPLFPKAMQLPPLAHGDNPLDTDFSKVADTGRVPFQLAQPDLACRKIVSLPTQQERLTASFARLRVLHRFYLQAVILRSAPLVTQASLTASYQEALQIAGNFVVNSRVPYFSPQSPQPPAPAAPGSLSASVPGLGVLLPRYKPSPEMSLDAFLKQPVAFLTGASDGSRTLEADSQGSLSGNTQAGNAAAPPTSSSDFGVEQKRDESEVSNQSISLTPDQLKELQALLDRSTRTPIDARHRARLFSLLALAASPNGQTSSTPDVDTSSPEADPQGRTIHPLAESAARVLGLVSPGVFGLLADTNPAVAARVVLHLPPQFRGDAMNELLQVANITLGRVQTVAALAGIADPNGQSAVDTQATTNQVFEGEAGSASGASAYQSTSAINEMFIRQFLASALSRCRQIPDQTLQQRFARALVVFVTALSRRFPAAVSAMGAEIKNFCLEFTKVFGTAELFQQLCT